MPLISVIIPVHNTEKYLPRCINSVLTQTLPDIEILLIDDGSTDGSENLCDDYARTDKRIQAIHTPHCGVSHARNTGLDAAEGKYISFIDSDDWAETDMLATLYGLIRRNRTDLSTCGYRIEDEEGNTVYTVRQTVTCTLGKWEAIHSLFHDKYYKYKGNLCDKLYDKKIIDNHRLRFREDLCYNEDRLFIFHYLGHCRSISYTTIPYYHYITRTTSAMGSFQHTYQDKLLTFMDAFDEMTACSQSFPISIRQSLSTDYIRSSLSFFIRYSHHLPLSEIWKRFNKIRKEHIGNLPLPQKRKYFLSFFRLLFHILVTRL